MMQQPQADRSMRSPVRTIAIIGGGFSGTVLAAALLRQPPSQPCRIVLVERREQIGRGVAYRRSQFRPLLNVPAGRMSADPADALQFARFAQRHGSGSGSAAQQFLPRELYGEYLQDLLRQAREAAPAHVGFERLHAEATTIHRIDAAGPYLIELSAAQQLLADQVVLACGDPPPAAPAAASDIAGDPRFQCDPHCDQALRADCGSVLLIGTGLTMADAAVAAAASSARIAIHAISRHGLLPAVQSVAAPRSSAADRDFLSYVGQGAFGARALLRAFRAQLRELARTGGDWRDAVNAVRAAAPALWRRLAQPERARFLRHLRVYWDAHRHRMPPEIGERLDALRRTGRLRIHAGNIVRIEDDGAALRVRWRPRGTNSAAELRVERVINCAGTDRRLGRSADPLLQAMLASGLAVPDALGLGWRTGAHGALVDRDGRTAAHLFYLGPMLRAEHWEATAVGELRMHAQRLAAALVQINA
jgi:uncharacterized NAD(P)/FAD-binding protein YdhS